MKELNTTALKANLLGRFSLSADECPVSLGGPKQQALFAYLAFHVGEPVFREELVSLLWGDRFDIQGRQSLRQALARLRKTLASFNAGIVSVDGEKVLLSRDNIIIDLRQFHEEAQGSTVAEWQAAAARFNTLLDGMSIRQSGFENWLSSARQMLAQSASDLFNQLSNAFMQSGEFDAGLAIAKRWIALDPFNEPAQRRAIEVLFAAGDQAGAMKRYHDLAETLSRELGAEPARETLALMAAMQGKAERIDSASTPRFRVNAKNKPALAVLPFQNMSDDPEQEYFSDGLTEDIIFALSHWNSFLVIARNSTFQYKGSSPDVRQVATHLGVEYVLEGSVRHADDRVRIYVRLIDATIGSHVWAARFDRKLDDFFELQDEIAQLVAAKVEPEFAKAEQKKAAQKAPSGLDAWESYQRGIAALNELTVEGNLRAQKFFSRAIEMNPDDSRIHSGMAYCLFRYSYDGFSNEPVRTSEEGLKYARRAIELDAGDAQAHETLAILFIHAGDAEAAIVEARCAVEINPNFAHAHIPLGNSLSLVGRPAEGIPYLEKAIRLNPDDVRGHIYLSLLADAYLNNRNYSQSAETARKAIERKRDYPHPYMTLASALGHQGKIEEAEGALADCQRLHSDYLRIHPLLAFYSNAADREHYIEGLLAAGHNN